MAPESVALFEDLRPAIKDRWSTKLCETPPAPAVAVGLVTPAMLVLMLDDTLGLLNQRLRTHRRTDRQKRDLTAFSAMRRGCRCGLHLLLNYYLAGAHALRDLLPPQLGPVRVEILAQFNRLAHDEMSSLCGVCLHRGGSLCSLERRTECAASRQRAECGAPATRSAAGLGARQAAP